jgi:hypothetical protein
LSQWKNTGSEIHLVGLSRGDHELHIRGERDGQFSSNVLQYDIFIKTPFNLLGGVFLFLSFWPW